MRSAENRSAAAVVQPTLDVARRDALCFLESEKHRAKDSNAGGGPTQIPLPHMCQANQLVPVRYDLRIQSLVVGAVQTWTYLKHQSTPQTLYQASISLVGWQIQQMAAGAIACQELPSVKLFGNTKYAVDVRQVCAQHHPEESAQLEVSLGEPSMDKWFADMSFPSPADLSNPLPVTLMPSYPTSSSSFDPLSHNSMMPPHYPLRPHWTVSCLSYLTLYLLRKTSTILFLGKSVQGFCDSRLRMVSLNKLKLNSSPFSSSPMDGEMSKPDEAMYPAQIAGRVSAALIADYVPGAHAWRALSGAAPARESALETF
ncbi:hypothetical protein V8D89_009377 [Ganoderma adspersum]